MKLWMVGINHKTSPIEIREKFYLSPLQRELLLSELKNNPSVAEAIVLSTCNRTEIYAHLIEDSPQALFHQLFRVKNLSFSPDFQNYFYQYKDQEAVGQLFRVVTGLNSLIFGEEQILGQVKEAIRVSEEKGLLAKDFHLLSRLAIRTGKLARSTTQISSGGSSVGWASVVMAQELLGSLADKRILIIGAGKMGKLTVQQFKNKPIGELFVINRSEEKAQSLAQGIGATVVSFWDLKEVLAQVDVCITCTGCPHYLVEKVCIEKVMQTRAGKRLICVDISVPRNIDPLVKDIPGVTLVSIDDLDKVVGENEAIRQLAVQDVEALIEKKIAEFYIKSQNPNPKLSCFSQYSGKQDPDFLKESIKQTSGQINPSAQIPMTQKAVSVIGSL